jgi:hypothetical protein
MVPYTGILSWERRVLSCEPFDCQLTSTVDLRQEVSGSSLLASTPLLFRQRSPCQRLYLGHVNTEKRTTSLGPLPCDDWVARLPI